jgi:hypothetical protein
MTCHVAVRDIPHALQQCVIDEFWGDQKTLLPELPEFRVAEAGGGGWWGSDGCCCHPFDLEERPGAACGVRA